MRQMTMAKAEAVTITAQSVGLCSCGHSLIRHFFVEMEEGSQDFMFSWRQQNVPMEVGAIDATYKRGKALLDDNCRQTQWSNDVQVRMRVRVRVRVRVGINLAEAVQAAVAQQVAQVAVGLHQLRRARRVATREAQLPVCCAQRRRAAVA